MNKLDVILIISTLVICVPSFIIIYRIRSKLYSTKLPKFKTVGFQVDGSSVNDWCLHGNTVQQGIPTPENPIMPEEYRSSEND